MRKTYIDNIRWITVVLVVIYHVIYMFNGYTQYGIIGPFCDNQPQDVYMYIVYPWFMLLLFVISGMSARFDLEKRSEKEFIRVRTRKLLVPSTIGLFVFGWVLGYYNMLLGGAFENMTNVPKPIIFLIMCISGSGPLWFIQMLWLFSIILVWIRRIEKGKLYDFCKKANVVVLFALVVIIYGAAQILNMPIIVVYRFGIYGVGFFIGYFVLSHDEVMEKLERKWILCTILALASGIAFVYMYMGQNYADHAVLDTPVCNIFAWLATLGVLAFMKKWGGFENSFTKWMNRKSWGLYVFHYLPIAVVSWYLCGNDPQRIPLFVYMDRVLPHGLAIFFVYLLVTVAGFAGAFILYEIISRIPIVNWCVLGIKKEETK